jgi:flagellar motility protein MotE (MotC chaperone)
MREDYEKQVSDLSNVLSKAKEAYLNISQQFKQSQEQQQQSQGNNEQLTQLQTENERLKKELLVQRETYEVRLPFLHLSL